jgi:aspartate/methionine/tyrosine aminotransferase
MQRAAIELLSLDNVVAETAAIQRTFARKREIMLEGLRKIGVGVDVPPEGTFYVWGSVAELPDGLNEGVAFFKQALTRKVIAVPGQFFDVNPGKRRAGRASRFARHIRFSFGPPEEVLVRALSRFEAMIAAAR